MQTLGPPHVFLQLIFKFCVKVYDPLAVLFSNSNEIGEVGPSFVLERCQDFLFLISSKSSLKSCNWGPMRQFDSESTRKTSRFRYST